MASSDKINVIEDKNLYDVKEIVKRSENPDPRIFIFSLFVSCLVVYMIYICHCKKIMTGVWLDESNNEHNIFHNKWTDDIIIDSSYNGTVKGHMVLYNNRNKKNIGLWLHDKIHWTNNTIWYSKYGC